MPASGWVSPGRLSFDRVFMMIRLLTISVLMFMTGGCAYGISHEAETLRPEGLARGRRIVVVPFRYSHRWTGFVRGIYKSAGLEPPSVEKMEKIEATFLLEGILLKRGYEVKELPESLSLPVGLPVGSLASSLGWGDDLLGEKRQAALARIQASGAQAFLVVRGKSNCPQLYHCLAEVEMKLMDTESGEVLWRSKATGETLIGQGNEMLAAVEEALGPLPTSVPTPVR